MQILIRGSDTRHGVGKGEIGGEWHNAYHRLQSKKRTLELEYFCKKWLFHMKEVCILLEAAMLLNEITLVPRKNISLK